MATILITICLFLHVANLWLVQNNSFKGIFSNLQIGLTIAFNNIGFSGQYPLQWQPFPISLLSLQSDNKKNRKMFTHQTKVRVRYAETDKMGYLYYGHYPKYYEIGRVEAMRHLGISYRDLEDVEGIIMPVMSLNMRFVRPAYYDDLLTIKTIIRQIPLQTITFNHEVYKENGDLVNGGSVKLCFVQKTTNKTVEVPTILIDQLQPFW